MTIPTPAELGFTENFDANAPKLASRRREAKRSPANAQKPEIHLSDTVNAEKIVEMFGDILRFDHRRKRWLVWQGHRWQPDTDGSISRFAIEAARKRYQEAVDIESFTDREKVSRWSIQSESKTKLDDALSIARALLPIADKGEGWDTDPMLLSCPNGIVDLVAGTLRDGLPEDRITMSTTVEFKPDEECLRWELFLSEIFEGNQELIRYIQKALGYSITGKVSEQCAFFCFGAGSNGKSVLFRTIREILGDYAYDAPTSLLQRNFQTTSTNDVAATEFKRFLVSSETLSTAKLNEQRLKAWTGGDKQTARYLYSEFFSFNPTVKPWLFINHKPQVEDDSYAFWRRVKLIPFNKQFKGEDADKDLYDKLMNEAKGILAWLVKGCLLWQEEGLEPAPAVVEEATQTYRAENDEIFDFLVSDSIKDLSEVKASEAYLLYSRWAEEQGFKPQDILSKTNFGRRMSDKYKKERKMDGNYYILAEKYVGFDDNLGTHVGLDPILHKLPTRATTTRSFIKTTSNYTYKAKKDPQLYIKNTKNDDLEEENLDWYKELAQGKGKK